MIAQGLPTAGFGEYQNFSPPNFKAFQSTLKTHLLVQSLLIGVASSAVIFAVVILPPLMWAAPFFALGSFAVMGVRTFLKYLAHLSYFPPDLIKGLNPKDFQAKSVGETILENGPGLVLTNSMETQKYKLDLISKAEQSIFFSCYMGGIALEETLHKIRERMEQKKELKVFILGSHQFLTAENRKHFDKLKGIYPDRFYSVLTPEIYYSEHPHGGRSLLCTNHIKLMTIDQGAYMITGGSALIPFWTQVTGEEHLEKLPTSFFNPTNLLEAQGFRDTDFAFKCGPKGAGMTAFLEGVKLMLRYAYMQNSDLAQTLKEQFLKLLKNPHSDVKVPSIDAHPQRVEQLKMQLFATAPEHTKNAYLHKLIDLVNCAKDKIVIGQMFFHPPQSLLDALKRASERKVKIEIITNSKEKEAPLSHRFFSDLGQTTYRQLFEGKGHEHVKVYEFYRANTTYHKKIIVVDGQYTAIGSANFGIKSLDENPADYEFDCVIDSKPFANQTVGVLEKDISFSNEISPNKARNPSWATSIAAWFQHHIMTHLL